MLRTRLSQQTGSTSAIQARLAVGTRYAKMRVGSVTVGFLLLPSPPRGVAVCDRAGGKNPELCCPPPPPPPPLNELIVVAGVADSLISNSARNNLFCFLDAFNCRSNQFRSSSMVDSRSRMNFKSFLMLVAKVSKRKASERYQSLSF